jgi:glycerophosphoryl diester phosphodiesterase
LSPPAEHPGAAPPPPAPELPRALLVDAVPPDWRARLERLQCEALNADWHALDAELVAAGHRSGYRVLTYTANDPQRVAQLAAWGLDAIITDAIDIVRPV